MKTSIAKHAAMLMVTAAVAVSASAASAEKWDMPLAYSATNFHSATAAEFAKCITTGTGGASARSISCWI